MFTRACACAVAGLAAATAPAPTTRIAQLEERVARLESSIAALTQLHDANSSSRGWPVTNATMPKLLPKPPPRPLFLRQALHNRSVLFYGPAATGCRVQSDAGRCSYDVTIITNNMFTVLPPDSCAAPTTPPLRLLVVNRLFSHLLEGHFANGSYPTHFAALGGILCTDRSTCTRLDATLRPAPHLTFAWMKGPELPGVANTLPYVLKAMRGTGWRKLHVTGVTFYDAVRLCGDCVPCREPLVCHASAVHVYPWSAPIARAELAPLMAS